ncbi:MAG: alpha/beta hydrolase [Desulfatiglans sp.]|jgi:pimeloyl-ACP methyl ester carboxylesterase|nr:alpha/beta hydrolase [Desulfatiglans sp.]
MITYRVATLFLSLFIITGMVYLMACLFYLLLHRYFVIFPSRRLLKSPSDYALQYEEVSFYIKDNALIYGWYIKGESIDNWKDYTILFFPGNKGNMSDFLLQVKHLAETGFNVLLFGCRGFSSIADVAARAVKWLLLRILTRERFDTKRYLAGVHCPVMIIHSREDKAIPPCDAENLLAAVKGKKKRVVISGPHAKGLEYDSAEYMKELKGFLQAIS